MAAFTVLHHLQRYYQEYELRGGRSLPTMQAHARHVEEHFGPRVAHTVRVDDVRAYALKRRKEGISNGTINRELGILRASLRMAEDAGELDRAPKIPKLAEENVRQGTFTREEVDRMAAELPRHLQPVVWFAYHTGRRRGEILQLRWDDVDLKRRIITVRQGTTKTGEPDRIPLQGELYELMLDLWERRDQRVPWVFSHNKEQIPSDSHPFQRAAQRAGLEDKHFHDLRRSMATDAIDAGLDQSVVMKITGHKTDGMFRRYRIVRTEGIRDGLAKVEEYRKQQSE